MSAPSPTSEVDLIKLAADQIGEAALITSIDLPTTETEKLFARNYPQARRALLREFAWNFAKERDTASLDSSWSGSSKFDYEDRYTLPNDCLRVLSVAGDSEIDYEPDYDVSGRYILCNNGGASSLKIRYIKDVTDVTMMDPLFIEVLVLKLALKCCFQLTKKKALQETLNELYAAEIPGAISIDGQERPPRRRQRSRYRDIRTRNSTVHPKYTVVD